MNRITDASRPHVRIVRWLSTCLALIPVVAFAIPPTKLSIAASDGSSVTGSQTTRSGSAATDKAVYGIGSFFSNQLYSVSVLGGASMPLTSSFVDLGNVYSYVISPDNTQVVFTADTHSAPNNVALYVVPISGGEIKKLSGELLANQSADYEFGITRDSLKVVFRIHETGTTAQTEIYSVPISGESLPKQLSATPGAPGYPHSIVLSDDSQRVLFMRPHDANQDALFSVPLDGSAAPVKLSKAIEPGGFPSSVMSFSIAPNSQYVVYDALDGAETVNLYRVPIGGGVAVGLTSFVPAGQGDFRGAYLSWFSSDASQIAFGAWGEPSGKCSVYRVSSQGGNSTRTLGPSSRGILTKRTADESRSVTRMLQSDAAGDAFNLFSATSADGSPPTRLFDAIARRDTQNLGPYDFRLTDDSSRVVFASDRDVAGRFELYSNSTVGGQLAKLSGRMTGDMRVDPSAYQLTRDSKHVVFRKTRGSGDLFELYSARTSGGLPTKLSGSIFGNANVYDRFHLTNDSKYVVFLQRAEGSNAIELFSIPVDGGGLLLDIDGDGVVQTETDVLLMVRYLAGFRGESLTLGAIGLNAARGASDLIESYLSSLLQNALNPLDVDGDGAVNTATDVLLIARYLLATTETMRIENAVNPLGTRVTAELVADRLLRLVEASSLP
jgi:hypothetical protein